MVVRVRVRKCQADGGPEACDSSKCPEKVDYVKVIQAMYSAAVSFEEYSRLRDAAERAEAVNPRLRELLNEEMNSDRVDVAAERAALLEDVEAHALRNDKSSIGYSGDLSDFKPEAPRDSETLAMQAGFFNAPSRTYGETYIEPIMRFLYNYEVSGTNTHDAVDKVTGEKLEIKAAKVLEAKEDPDATNLFEKICNENQNSQITRSVSFADRHSGAYNANIQNVKRDEFDSLVYVLLYKEGIQIFKVKKGQIESGIENWSGHHGLKDAPGENGQFNVNSKHLAYHEKNHFDRFITYTELVNIAKGIKVEPKKKKSVGRKKPAVKKKPAAGKSAVKKGSEE